MNSSILTIKTKVPDHILFLQHLINHTSTGALQSRHKNHRTPCESSIRGQSHSAGITAAMVDNSPPSATFFDINERNLESPASRLVQSAGQSSHELLLETGTWPMRSASKGGTPIIKPALELQIMQSIRSLLLSRCYFWSWSITSHIPTRLGMPVDILRRYDNHDTLFQLSLGFSCRTVWLFRGERFGFFGGCELYPHTHNRFVSHLKNTQSIIASTSPQNWHIVNSNGLRHSSQ